MRAIEATAHAPRRALTPARQDPLGALGQTMARRAVIPSNVLSQPGLRANPPTPAPPSVAIAGPPRPQPKLLDRIREALRSRHYSRLSATAQAGRTEQCYCHWACLPRREAAQRRQAKRFILGDVIRARKPRHLPVVLTREEVKVVLRCLHGDKWLMASLMYGAGLRLMECLRLRVQDIDFARNEIIVRDGKGAKDRVTMLPESLTATLQEHLRVVKIIHEQDLADGWGRVQMPHALDRKYPAAAAEWRWRWVFPQENRWRNASTREEGRHHVDESLVQRAVKDAAHKARIVKRGTCHTCAIHLPPMCWKPGMTFAQCRSFSGTRMSARR